MNWESIINNLQEKMTQQEIAKGAGCSQASISLLAKGKRKDVLYSTGQKILALCVLHDIQVTSNKKTSDNQS